MKASDLFRHLKNIFSQILRAEFLVMDCEKYFIHIIYTFFLMWMMIWISIKVENTLVAVEKNKVILNDMKIYNAQKTVQLVSLNRITKVEKLLKDNASEVAFPVKPADKLDK